MVGAEGMTRMLWLQGASCGGCTMSILESGASGWFDQLRQSGIDLVWHPSVSEETGEEAAELLEAIRDGRERLDLLVLEGSVARGPNLSGRFNLLAGTNRSIYHWLLDLAPLADYVVAVGSCAAYGGIPAAGINPTDAVGLQFEGSDVGGALGAG
ncbi:MAG: HupU protein, partial [Bradyrhizobium sp.]